MTKNEENVQNALRLPRMLQHARILARDERLLAANTAYTSKRKPGRPAETLKLETYEQRRLLI